MNTDEKDVFERVVWFFIQKISVSLRSSVVNWLEKDFSDTFLEIHGTCPELIEVFVAKRIGWFTAAVTAAGAVFVFKNIRADP